MREVGILGLGKVLRRRIEANGRTINETAKDAGVSPSTLSSFLRRDLASGGNHSVMLTRVARVLGTTVEDLLEEAGLLEPQKAPSGSAEFLARVENLDNEGAAAVLRTLEREERRMREKEERDEPSLVRAHGLPPFIQLNGDAERDLDATMFFVEVLQPDILPGLRAGDVLTVHGEKKPDVGELGIYRWQNRQHLCRRLPGRLEVLGDGRKIRYAGEPAECLGRVMGRLHIYPYGVDSFF